jgi:hypothetical protein
MQMRVSTIVECKDGSRKPYDKFWNIPDHTWAERVCIYYDNQLTATLIVDQTEMKDLQQAIQDLMAINAERQDEIVKLTHRITLLEGASQLND